MNLNLMIQPLMPCLVILAAGLGSRFGGDKQLALLGTTARTLLHFSVMDAYRAGIRQVILIVRPALIPIMQQQVLCHFPRDLSIDFVVQDLTALPVKSSISSQRTKPWGTAHALWCARTLVADKPCIVINADDYYSPQAMVLLVKHFMHPVLNRCEPKSSENNELPETGHSWAMVTFPLHQTLSSHGGVNRGICQMNAESTQSIQTLRSIEEWTDIQQQHTILGTNPAGVRLNLPADTPVSMNIWGFTPKIFSFLTAAFTEFIQQGPKDKDECYLPEVVHRAIQTGQTVNVYKSQEPWFGMTYPADLPRIVEFFQQQPQT